MLLELCTSIRDYEGSQKNSHGLPDRNWRNNNPGNCRYSPVGYLPIYGKVGKDKDGFAIFKDYDTGFLYLENLIKSKIAKNPNQTLFQFMCVYAPKEDGNDPAKYAQYLANRLGITEDYKMKVFI